MQFHTDASLSLSLSLTHTHTHTHSCRIYSMMHVRVHALTLRVATLVYAKKPEESKRSATSPGPSWGWMQPELSTICG